MAYFVYILFSEKLDRFYIGTTTDVKKRLAEHNDVHYPNSYTRKGIPWTIYLIIPCENSHLAYQLERFIKKMKSKNFILKLKNDPEVIPSILEKLMKNP